VCGLEVFVWCVSVSCVFILLCVVCVGGSV